MQTPQQTRFLIGVFPRLVVFAELRMNHTGVRDMNNFLNPGLLIMVGSALMASAATAQTTISEARGFLALKALASDSLLQNELSLSSDEIAVLREEYRHYSAKVDARLEDDGFPVRRVLWNSLTPEIEAKLDEILTTQTFQRYSHHVILQKVGGLRGW